MTPEYEAFYDAHLQRAEGGVTNHKDDAGSETWYGVSSAFLDGIGRKGPVSREEAKQIFYDYFWEPSGCQQMDPVAAWAYCDALVNHRPAAAAKMLQHALQVTVDGVIGEETKAAAVSVNRKMFLERYRVYRVRFYVKICKNNISQMVFLVGWMDRVHILFEAILLQGLLKSELQKLPWYSPDNYTETTKSAGIGLGMAGAVIALFFPDIDLQNVLQDPEAFKATLIGVATFMTAKWKSRTV
jgi:hypothetical protein